MCVSSDSPVSATLAAGFQECIKHVADESNKTVAIFIVVVVVPPLGIALPIMSGLINN